MNFCDCDVNILNIWSWQCIFESLNLRDGHLKKFGYEFKILFFSVPLNPSFENYGPYKLENMVNNESPGKIKKNT